ncbi:MAG: capsule assembly Wzi family protein, partial [Pseudomonadales bacterium]|nr:capsule assembly Wzi family protein [Pseudomonadales bacterium]
REDAELGVRASWLGTRLAANVQLAVVADPADNKEFRYDGSYVGVNLGNFMISAGAMERWWGPGFEGSLILSNNARPIPSITIERNYTDPFKSKWLSWIGPWRASIALGRAEGSDVALPNTRFFAARVNFRPRSWLELGLTRTAQWCGDGRPCSLRTFGDLLIGRDNRSDSLTINQEPGNQMAGYDVRLRSPWRALPLAVYGQFIGEDEAGGLPSKFLGLVGAEWWGSVSWGSYRLHAELADTACEFSRSSPQFDCAYRNGLYPQGYTYRGRVIGHSMDQDSRMYSLGATLVRADGDAVNVLVRRSDLNRDNGSNFVAAGPVEIQNVELQYSRALWTGKMSIGLGYDDASDAAASSDIRGFVSWRQPL